MSITITRIWKYIATKEIETKIIISIFYVVGVIGLLLPITYPYFTKLIPFALILSLLILTIFYPDKPRIKPMLIFVFIYLLSFIIELVGVNTGLIFGNYIYGNSLGLKISNTPLIIGLNWLLLVYISSSAIEKLRIHLILKIVLASLFMLLYDIILEQVAPKINMWHWIENNAPFQNYVTWFAMALFFHSLIKIFKIKTENRMAMTILISQFMFFLILSILLK